ncbi:MAG: DUF4097 family beta strand repeat-containing protein [Acidobacteriota bacterium]
MKMFKAKQVGLFILAVLIAATGFGLQAQQGSAQTRSFQVQAGERLDVTTRGGDIQITPWAKNEVLVQAEGIDPENAQFLQMNQAGGVVRVDYRPKGETSERVRFLIHAPARFHFELKTSGGDIATTGLVSGTLQGSTSGGDIKLVDVDGKTTLSTSGGDVTAGSVRGEAVLKTSGGDINIQAASGQVDVFTSGGDINVGSVGKTLRANTSGGDIVVGDVGGDATVSTSGGDIRVGRVSGTAKLNTSGGDIELQGSSGPVDAKTSGGDLRLRGVTGSINAATSGGDIQADLSPSGTGQSRITTSGGDITLSLPENARASVDARIELGDNWERNNKKYDIRSDFKSETYVRDDKLEEIRATYKVNGGGEMIQLETSGGNIQIRKAGTIPK